MSRVLGLSLVKRLRTSTLVTIHRLVFGRAGRGVPNRDAAVASTKLPGGARALRRRDATRSVAVATEVLVEVGGLQPVPTRLALASRSNH